MLIHVNRQGRNNLEYEKVQLLNLVVEEKETKNGKATNRLQEELHQEKKQDFNS
jgi:hypothetical protein